MNETKLALLDYPNPQGIHPIEAEWRDVAPREELGTRQASLTNQTVGQETPLLPSPL